MYIELPYTDSSTFYVPPKKCSKWSTQEQALGTLVQSLLRMLLPHIGVSRMQSQLHLWFQPPATARSMMKQVMGHPWGRPLWSSRRCQVSFVGGINPVTWHLTAASPRACSSRKLESGSRAWYQAQELCRKAGILTTRWAICICVPL